MTKKSNEPRALGRSRQKTAEVLDKVIDSILSSNEKLSISAVARAAGVTPGLIHNTYPAVAERIRGLIGKSVRAQRDSKHEALMKEKELNRTLRAEIAQLTEDLARLASVNQLLLLELAQLKGIARGNVVPLNSKPALK